MTCRSRRPSTIRLNERLASSISRIRLGRSGGTASSRSSSTARAAAAMDRTGRLTRRPTKTASTTAATRTASPAPAAHSGRAIVASSIRLVSRWTPTVQSPKRGVSRRRTRCQTSSSTTQVTSISGPERTSHLPSRVASVPRAASTGSPISSTVASGFEPPVSGGDQSMSRGWASTSRPRCRTNGVAAEGASSPTRCPERSATGTTWPSMPRKRPSRQRGVSCSTVVVFRSSTQSGSCQAEVRVHLPARSHSRNVSSADRSWSSASAARAPRYHTRPTPFGRKNPIPATWGVAAKAPDMNASSWASSSRSSVPAAASEAIQPACSATGWRWVSIRRSRVSSTALERSWTRFRVLSSALPRPSQRTTPAASATRAPSPNTATEVTGTRQRAPGFARAVSAIVQALLRSPARPGSPWRMCAVRRFLRQRLCGVPGNAGVPPAFVIPAKLVPAKAGSGNPCVLGTRASRPHSCSRALPTPLCGRDARVPRNPAQAPATRCAWRKSPPRTCLALAPSGPARRTPHPADAARAASGLRSGSVRPAPPFSFGASGTRP